MWHIMYFNCRYTNNTQFCAIIRLENILRDSQLGRQRERKTDTPIDLVEEQTRERDERENKIIKATE